MKIRGRRECKACGTRWSYYETGAVSCPDCGSAHSVGLDDERALHTATAATLDLAPVRGALDTEPIDRVAARANDRVREFTRGYGFIEAGRLGGLDDTYLAAMELKHVSAALGRRIGISDEEEWYFTELLRADEGSRPPADVVPETMRGARGLACADAAGEYRSDVRLYLGENPAPETTDPLQRLSSHIKRVRALDGDVPPRDSAALVDAARAIGRYLTGDEGGLAVAEERLASLG